jgi:competence protein ComEA
MENTRENLRNWWSDLHYSPLQKRSLAVVAALVFFTSAIFIMRTSSTSQAIPTPPLIVDVAISEITIDIQGAVLHPGVYTMTLGSRVFDAIKASGGTTKNADPSDVNQARKLSDGEQIYIYAKSSAASSSSKSAASSPRVKSKPAGFVLVNRANTKEFESLDGIGPVLASRIITFRKTNGPFLTIEDLLKVPGIGAATLAKFKSKVRL